MHTRCNNTCPAGARLQPPLPSPSPSVGHATREKNITRVGLSRALACPSARRLPDAPRAGQPDAADRYLRRPRRPLGAAQARTQLRARARAPTRSPVIEPSSSAAAASRRHLARSSACSRRTGEPAPSTREEEEEARETNRLANRKCQVSARSSLITQSGGGEPRALLAKRESLLGVARTRLALPSVVTHRGLCCSLLARPVGQLAE